MTINGTPTSVLIDSSFLFALNNPGDKNHQRVYQVVRLNIRYQIIPDIVLAETAFMLRHRINQLAVLNFLDALALSSSQTQLEPVSKEDLKRAREIMAIYKDADFDLADCCIMALSERLNILHVCTLDRRDFSIFRPKHSDYLILLP